LISALGGTWSQERLSLAAGTTVILCSDGLTESRDADGVMLGDAWTDDDIADLNRGTDSARSALEAIAAAARERAVAWRVDDLALLAMRRTA
jgi:serine phosphatase RsbU (regulator of sigma subunit)